MSVNRLPEEAQDLLLGTREGLTIYFDYDEALQEVATGVHRRLIASS